MIFFVDKYYKKSDSYLIKESQAGNQQAVLCLIKRYQHIVNYKAHRISYHLNDRDDYIQEGLIALYEAIHQYNNKKQTSFSTFIDMCIERKLTSYLRLKTTLKANILSQATSLHDPSIVITSLVTPAKTLPEAIILKKAKSRKLKRCISQYLTDQETEVIQLYLREETLKSIAETLNLSYKSVDNAMQRSIKKLRKCLELS